MPSSGPPGGAGPRGRQGSESMAHARRVAFLATLANLAGCHHALRHGLPDGVPDVLQVDLRRRVLFLGDAKDTETAGTCATVVRLTRYFRWVLAHVAAGRPVVLALCVGRRPETWAATLRGLAHEAGLQTLEVGTATFGRATYVVWVRLEPSGDSASPRAVSTLRHW